MSAPNGEAIGPNPYLFKRDFMGSIRLNYNHWLMKEVTHGHYLSPKIPDLGDMTFRVADVGTGTGIWANEFAASVGPKVRVTGFDIAPDQFPPAESRTENVDFVAHDCFKPFPPEYIGQFEIVHVRFLLCTVNNPDAEPLMRNISTLLRPGGYVQWTEPLPDESKVINSNPDMPSPAMDAMKKMWAKPQTTTSYEWVKGMPEIFASLSPPLTKISVDNIPMAPHHRLPWMQSSLLGLTEVIANNRTMPEEKLTEMRSWIGQLQEEAAKGMLIQTTFQVVVVKKAWSV